MEDFSKYIVEISQDDKNSIIKRITTFGYDDVFNKQLNYLDCTRVTSSGMRLMQTIGYPYMREISITLFIIELNDDSTKKEELLNILNKRHLDNLEYEKENPPVWYDKKLKGKVNTKIKEPKTPKEPKITVAQRKLAAKIAKINTLGLKLKPTIK